MRWKIIICRNCAETSRLHKAKDLNEIFKLRIDDENSSTKLVWKFYAQREWILRLQNLQNLQLC